MLFHVKKTPVMITLVNQLRRYAHSSAPIKVLHPLKSRNLLKIIGEDVPAFLQGLITNDMRHFEGGTKSMYSMFLNNKGRVLFDTLIHKWEGEETFLIECDKKIVSLLQKHLKIYKLRRKIEISEVNDLNVWSLIYPCIPAADLEINAKNKINIYKDPRLPELGFRVLAKNVLSGDDIAASVEKNIIVEKTEEHYKHLRYKLGVGEGADDLLPATCFPLEVNCDYLHGVSFHKGCYIGQELTARVHHTGVVRKRLMPLRFSTVPSDNLEKDTIISTSNNPKVNLGKLKGIAKDFGLGLMRIKESLDTKVLSIGNYTAEPIKPNWWPVEATKEKNNIKKTDELQA